MTKKNLVILVAVMVVLGGLYFLARPRTTQHESQDQVTLLSGIDGEKVAKVSVEQGEGKLELELKDGTWTIPSRAGYAAEGSKVRSLFLKLLDLSTSQSVPAGTAGLKKLGLDDKGVKNGRALVKFFDKDGHELGGVYLGETRKGEKSDEQGPRMTISGQYVRSTKNDRVFLVGLPVNITTAISEWLDTNLMNVLQSKVYEVVQTKIAPDGAKAKVFELVPESEDGRKEGTPLAFKPAAPVPVDFDLQKPVISQISSGLENVRFSDVRHADDAEVKDLVFDSETEYQSMDGLVYTVLTSQKGDKIHAKVRVHFDADLVKNLQELYAKRKEDRDKEKEKEKQAHPTPAPGETPTREEVDEPAEKSEQPKFSNADEASKIQARFEPWIYELANYQGQKFRKSADDLMQKKPPPADAQATAAPMTTPAPMSIP